MAMASRADRVSRAIPPQPWRRILVTTLVLVLSGTAAWEARMQAIGLKPGDLGDGPAHWAVERRKVDSAEPDDVVILGSSRILFDTDLDLFESQTGRRPIQLALPGTSPRQFLENLATETDFRGLVLVGVTPTAFFRDRAGLMADALDVYRDASPSARIGHRIYLFLSRWLGFLDPDYSLPKLIERLPLIERPGVEGPYEEVWKLSVAADDRQTSLWERIETDAYLRGHARHVWAGFAGDPLGDAEVQRAVDSSRDAVERIRARGGRVVFIRPPSEDPIRSNERRRVPRVFGWDRLLRSTGSFGIHFEDYPPMQGLDLPEHSHLTRDAARRFTLAYTRVLMDEIDWPGQTAAPSRKGPEQ
jgi:hypothetical protein